MRVGAGTARDVEALLLDLSGLRPAQASEAVLPCASKEGHQVAVLIPRLCHTGGGREGRKLDRDSVEETSVFAAASCKMDTDTGRTCAGASGYDVVGVSTELGDVELRPLQRLSLVSETVICRNFVAVGHEAKRPNTTYKVPLLALTAS